MKASKKRNPQKNRGVSSHLTNLHHRLYHAFNLGFSSSDQKEKKWHTNDVEIQRLVLRSISSFLDCVTAETLHSPLVKDSVADMVMALEGILRHKNEAVLAMASATAVKLTSTLPNSMMHPYVLQLVLPLSSLLSFQQLQVAISCATALRTIILNLSMKKEKEACNILRETDAVTLIINNLRNFLDPAKPVDFFVVMASLLSAILHRWPPARYPVWNDVKLRGVFKVLCVNPDTNVKIAVLQLYSSLALCSNGAQKLLESPNDLLQMIVQYMGDSQPLSLRIPAFKLVQHLMGNGQGRTKMLRLFLEPLMKSIISGMSAWSMHYGKVSNDEMSLLVEACRFARITRWPGKHHAYLWKLRVDRALVNLVMHNLENTGPQKFLSLEELINVTRECLDIDFFLSLRPYVWEILGWLAAHCDEDFSPDKYGDGFHLDVLITAACIGFAELIGSKRLLYQADSTNISRNVSVSLAALMMVYSPCTYIASQARLVLFELLRSDGDELMKYVLRALNFIFSSNSSTFPDESQIILNMIGLLSFIALPQFQVLIIKNRGLGTLLTFVRWYSNNHVHIERRTVETHLHGKSTERTCCAVGTQDWEGSDILLILGFWALAELIKCDFEGVLVDEFSGESKEQILKDVEDICISSSSSGLRWYSSYLLSCFGFYGSPISFGRRISMALGENEHADTRLVLRSGESVSVHSVILSVRCPALLPWNAPDEEKISDKSSVDCPQSVKREVNLSSYVDYETLMKLLQYIYSGYVQVGEDMVRKLKLLAKHCRLQPLLQLLCKKRPTWGDPAPGFDLMPALGPLGRESTDIIVEAKCSADMGWKCSSCSSSVPHLHAHRVVLWSSCEYMRALFQSGMQESHSHTIKVPVTWEALKKLLVWIYSDELPNPISGCLWENIDIETKLAELKPYIELCWLGEFWFLDDVRNQCFEVITSYLDSEPELSVKAIQVAADFSQWKLVEVAANSVAPFYHTLRESGGLDDLDDELLDMIRLASVHLSQER